MLLTIKAALSCTWLPPTGSQESFRYGQLADLGCHEWAGYPDPGFQDQVLGDPSTALFLFSFQAVFKSGIQVDLEARDFEGELVVARAGVSGRQGNWSGWVPRCSSLTVAFHRPYPPPHGHPGSQRCYAPT